MSLCMWSHVTDHPHLCLIVSCKAPYLSSVSDVCLFSPKLRLVTCLESMIMLKVLCWFNVRILLYLNKRLHLHLRSPPIPDRKLDPNMECVGVMLVLMKCT